MKLQRLGGPMNPKATITDEQFQAYLKQIRELAEGPFDEMQKEIEAKQAQIESINAQIKEISITQEETKRFMSNLEKFIK